MLAELVSVGLVLFEVEMCGLMQFSVPHPRCGGLE